MSQACRGSKNERTMASQDQGENFTDVFKPRVYLEAMQSMRPIPRLAVDHLVRFGSQAEVVLIIFFFLVVRAVFITVCALFVFVFVEVRAS